MTKRTNERFIIDNLPYHIAISCAEKHNIELPAYWSTAHTAPRLRVRVVHLAGYTVCGLDLRRNTQKTTAVSFCAPHDRPQWSRDDALALALRRHAKGLEIPDGPQRPLLAVVTHAVVLEHEYVPGVIYERVSTALDAALTPPQHFVIQDRPSGWFRTRHHQWTDNALNAQVYPTKERAAIDADQPHELIVDLDRYLARKIAKNTRRL